MGATPRGRRHELDVVDRGVAFQERSEVLDGDSTSHQFLESARERHLAKLVVVAVGLAVGGNRHQRFAEGIHRHRRMRSASPWFSGLGRGHHHRTLQQLCSRGERVSPRDTVVERAAEGNGV